MDNVYEARRKEFGEAYEDFEGTEIVRLAKATGEWLEILLDEPEAVAAAMRVLHDRLVEGGPSNGEASDWRLTWDGMGDDDASTLRTSQMMVSLNAFAFFGLRPDLEFFGFTTDEASLETSLLAFVAKGRRILDAIPSTWGKPADLERTVLAAEGRLALDAGQDVSPERLAALARISLKSVRNMLTPKAGGADLTLNVDGLVPHAEALRWLEGREDFRSSIWRTADPAPRVSEGDEVADLGEVVFVPVTKEREWFDPVSCRNGRGYTIGPKGAEEPVDDYREALARLARMPRPYWRRPNAQGHWGLVRGVDWRRVPVAELSETGAT